MHHGICRFFIKYILTDEQLHHMGTFWATRFEVMLHHTCPLCKHGVGTPIDYVMICSETNQYTEAMRDAVDNSFANSFVVPEQHFAIADTWFVLNACNCLFNNSEEEHRSSDTYDKVRQQAMYLENDFDMRTHVSFLLRCVGAKWKQ